MIRTQFKTKGDVATVAEILSAVRSVYPGTVRIECGMRPSGHAGDLSPNVDTWREGSDLHGLEPLSSVLRNVRNQPWPQSFTFDLYCYGTDESAVLEGNVDVTRINGRIWSIDS